MYKTEKYLGVKVYFRPYTKGNYKVVAQVPKITSQYIGAGRTKKEAFNDAKPVIKKWLKRRKSIKERIKLNYPKGFPYR